MRRTPGRPRSEEARRAVLASAVQIVEEDGYGALTMERIARAAGVSKQTVYRWWPSKASVVLEALNEGARTIAPLPDTGELESDLTAFLRGTVRGARSRSTRLLAAMMAEAQLNEAFGESFRREFLGRRRQVMRELLEHARTRGEIGGAVDLDRAVEVVFATLWYRILVRNAPLDRRFADELCDTVLRLVGG